MAGKHRQKKALGRRSIEGLAALALVGCVTALGFGVQSVGSEVKAKIAPGVSLPSATAQASQSSTEAELCANFAAQKVKCKVSWTVSDSLPVGQLIKQVPKAGQRSEAVTLTYAAGRSVVTMPILAGLTGEEAKKILWQAGLKLGNESSTNGSSTAGTILSTSLKPSASVPHATAVDLVYSNGKVKIPDWTGKPKEYVKAEATRLGLTIKFSEAESTSAAGTVIKEEQIGATVPFNSTLKITLAKASNVEKLTLPDVVGLTQIEATSLLAAKGFLKITSLVEASPSSKADAVIAMEPMAGTATESSSEIKLTVKKGN